MISDPHTLTFVTEYHDPVTSFRYSLFYHYDIVICVSSYIIVPERKVRTRTVVTGENSSESPNRLFMKFIIFDISTHFKNTKTCIGKKTKIFKKPLQNKKISYIMQSL